MDLLVQAGVATSMLLLSGLGAASAFAPKAMVSNFGVDPVGRAGLSTVRSLIGGTFITAASLLAIGLVTGETTWLLAVALLLAVVAIGRLVSFATDGFEQKMLPPLIVEIVVASVLVYAHLVASA